VSDGRRPAVTDDEILTSARLIHRPDWSAMCRGCGAVDGQYIQPWPCETAELFLDRIELPRADKEAQVVEAAVVWLEAITDHPWQWAGREDLALVRATQDLIGDVRWPEIREPSQ
jgi:hypothetical protein